MMFENKAVILCVDDEEIPLKLRRLVLEKAGYKVITAGSATEAWDIVTSRHIDLVLSDQLMPGSTGTELARNIKTKLPGLPVILHSGVNEVPSDADCADLFLSKVVGPVILCEKVSGVLAEAKTRKRHNLGSC
jgi:CheY-like chemotaxis protein